MLRKSAYNCKLQKRNLFLKITGVTTADFQIQGNSDNSNDLENKRDNGKAKDPATFLRNKEVRSGPPLDLGLSLVRCLKTTSGQKET